MTEYKTPKVIEKKPEAMGLSIGLVAVLFLCTILFAVTVFRNIFVGLFFLALGSGYYYVELKFPGKGEFLRYLYYLFGNHCIKIDQPLKNIIKTKESKT